MLFNKYKEDPEHEIVHTPSNYNAYNDMLKLDYTFSIYPYKRLVESY